MIWVLLGLLSLAASLVLAALLGLDDLPEEPARIPKHAEWTKEGGTTRLGPTFEHPAPMERDGGMAQRLRWPGSHSNRDTLD